jgi:hypothetical protein
LAPNTVGGNILRSLSHYLFPMNPLTPINLYAEEEGEGTEEKARNGFLKPPSHKRGLSYVNLFKQKIMGKYFFSLRYTFHKKWANYF